MAAYIVSPQAINKKIKTDLYTEDGKGPLGDRIIKGHLFGGACDWYLTEYSEEDDLGFGFCHIGNDQGAEWNYVSVAELREFNELPQLLKIEWDRYWKPVPANQIEKIVRCGGC